MRLDLLALQRLHGLRHREVGLAGAGGADAEHDRVLVDRVDVRLLARASSGRMILPRAERIASPSTSDGLRTALDVAGCGPSEDTSAGPRSCPALRHRERARRRARARAATASASPRERDLVAAHVHVDVGVLAARRRAAGGPAGRAAAPSRRRRRRRRLVDGGRGRRSSSGTKALLPRGRRRGMGVHVEDGLAGAGAGVEDEPEVAVASARRRGVRERRRARRAASGSPAASSTTLRYSSRLRDHQQVHGRLRRDVADRERILGLGDDLAPGSRARRCA